VGVLDAVGGVLPPSAPAPGGPALAPPGYEILGELGRGGIGVVYQARDLRLKRLVALKMIRSGGLAGPEERQRFQGEAEAVARLAHPGVVQVFEVGEHGGLPYLALEYLDGGSLAERLRGAPLPAREAAELVGALARAMHAAHERGIVHRDLKPGNVLLSGEGAPKVTDFGLARRLDDSAHPTVSGALIGTPSYMAPEQASPGKQVGPAADVYALGAVLYECLTGRPPFQAPTPLDTLMQVVSQEPVPVRRLQPKVPRDLETICLKALAKAPAARYGNAADLADDLRRFLSGEPIRARRVGPVGRLWRQCRRRPAVASLLFTLALVLGSAAGIGGSMKWEQGQRAARTEWLVNEAILEARRLLGESKWPEALAVVTRADHLLDSGGAVADLRQRVNDLRADVEMLERLEDVRLKKIPLKASPDPFAELDAAYAAAFRKYGIEVEALTPDGAAAWIRGRVIRDELTAALDDWALERRTAARAGAGDWKHLSAVARAADSDSIRNQLREALTTNNREALKKQAETAGVTELPVATLELLGKALSELGEAEAAVACLRRAHQKRPRSFSITHHLAMYLGSTTPPSAGRAGSFRHPGPGPAQRKRLGLFTSWKRT
jgi:serine/threonine-protein kinase